MSDVPLTQQKFIEALNALAAGPANPQELTTTLRRALLDFGSETPDNLNLANRVEVGRVGSHTGPKITGREALFSNRPVSAAFRSKRVDWIVSTKD